MRRLTLALLAPTLLLAACAVFISNSSGTFFFYFNTGWQGWETRGTDLQLGDGSVVWSINLSQELAFEGTSSVAYHLNNQNGAGKIWIERTFSVAPRHTYQVSVEYALSPVLAWDELETFQLITGAFPQPPRTADDLAGCFFDPRTHGDPSAPGSAWATKRFQFTVPSGESSALYVVVGMWGVWDAPISMWVDSLRVDLREM